MLIANELSEKGISFTATGRDVAKLDKLKKINENLISIFELDIERVDFISLFEKYDLIVNCIGPFNFYAPKIIDACIQQGKTYFDLTGEQAIVERSLRESHSNALETGARIVHSIAFESTLADILLSIGLNRLKSEKYASYNTYYKLGSKQMSPGTRISMKVAGVYPKFFVSEGNLLNDESFQRKINDAIDPYLAHFVGYPEVIFTHLRAQPLFCSSNFLVEKEDNMNYLGGMIQQKGIRIEEQISLHAKRKTTGPTAEERKNQTFELHAYFKTGNQCFYQKIEGIDMYGITASLMALAVEQFVSYGENIESLPNGLVTPGEFLGQTGMNWINTNPFCSITKSELKEL